MASKIQLEVVYSLESREEIKEIIAYLRNSFSEKEVKQFDLMLIEFDQRVINYPKVYPISNKKLRIRKAVLSKQLSVFYRVYRSHIFVATVKDNRCDTSEWS
jgi:hypothetical protein